MTEAVGRFGFGGDPSPWLACDGGPGGLISALEDPFRPLYFSPINDSAMRHLLRRINIECDGATCPKGGGEVMADVDMSDLDNILWRGGGLKGVRRAFRAFGPKWGKTFQTYFNLVPKQHRPSCARVLMQPLSGNVTQFRSLCESCGIDFLKEISVRATRCSIALGPGWWLYLCDIHVLGGYDTCLNRVDVLEGYEKVAGVSSGCADNGLLRRFIDSTIAMIGHRSPRDQVSFEQFIEFRDAWALPGASTLGKPSELLVKGKKRRVRGKFANLVSVSDREIVRTCLDRQPARIYPFRKADEPVKTRVIQAYDTNSYLRCSYADYMLGRYNDSTVWTTMGLSLKDRAHTRLELELAQRAGGYSAVSLDQTAFDTSQKKSAVTYVLQSLWDHVIRGARSHLQPELRLLRDAELYSFEHAHVWARSGASERLVSPWLSGIPSGHKWTGLMNSILNRAESLYVAQYLGADVYRGLWQGDDGVLLVRNSISAEAWAEGYATLGLGVNTAKTWVSRSRFEFLHEFHGPEGAWAMPARAAKSLLWRKPDTGGSGFTPRHLQKQELWSNYLRASRRGLRVYALALKSITADFAASGHHHPHDAAKEYMNTPAALGGGGWGTVGRLGAEWRAADLQWSRVKLLSPVAVHGKDRASVARAVVRRLGLSTPLPATPAKLTWWQVGTPAQMPSRSVLGDSRPPKDNWVLADYNRGLDAWDLKIRLEDALGGHGTLTRELCPSKLIAESPLGYDKAIRLLAKWGGWAPCFEGSWSNGESFWSAREWANRAWGGFLARLVALGGPLDQVLRESKTVALAAWKIVREGLVGPRVAV